MNKRKIVKKDDEETKHNGQNKWWILVGITAVFLLLAIGAIAFADSPNMSVGSGESVTLLCDGRGFSIGRESRTMLHVTCQPSNRQPQPTTAPPATATPITEPPVEPPVVPSPPPADGPGYNGTAYYVSPEGNDSNPGSLEAPWRTLGKANQSLSAGDILYIRAGQYNERIEPGQSGTANAPIVYTTYPGETATIRGIADQSHLAVLSNKSYIIIDGLSFTYGHNNPNKRFEWLLVTGTSAQYNTIRNNYIYRSGDPLQSYKDGYREWGIVVNQAKYTLIESNQIEGVFQGVHIKNSAQFTTVRYNTISGTSASSMHIGTSLGVMQGTLVENNILENSAIEDGIQFTQNFNAADPANDISNLGTIIRNNIIRNNAENAIDLKGAAHVVVEGNTIYGTIGSNDGPLSGWNRNSLGTIIRGTGTSTRDVIIRNNVFYDNANGVRLYQGYKVYNNSFVANNRDYTGSNSSWSNTSSPAFWSIHHFDPVITGVGVKNNLIVGQQVADVVMRLNQNQAQIDIDYNGYSGTLADLHAPSGYTNYANLSGWQDVVAQAKGFDGNEAHSVQMANPLFVNVPALPTGDPAQYDFRLQANSPAIDRGGWLTTARVGGSGTQIYVGDAGYFMDGFDIVAGDMIQIGSDVVARIVDVDYKNDMITVDRSISWDAGDGVSFPYKASAPDLGAFEYGN